MRGTTAANRIPKRFRDKGKEAVIEQRGSHGWNSYRRGLRFREVLNWPATLVNKSIAIHRYLSHILHGSAMSERRFHAVEG